MQPMKPLRAKMIRQMPLERLAPRTQDAYVEAVAGLAKFYWWSPDRLTPEQIRDYLHHLLGEPQLAWSSCNQIACGLKFFCLKILGWDVLPLNLPPRKGRSQLPQVLSLEALERLFMSLTNPTHRALLMATYAAGLRVREVTRLTFSDIARDRMLIRGEPGKGRKDRYTHRVAIANHRIVDGREGQVRFTSRDRRQGDGGRTLPLEACEWIRRFLLHVLPHGFVRLRHIGFLATRCQARTRGPCRQLLGQPPDTSASCVKSVAQWMQQWTGLDIRRGPHCGEGPLLRLPLPPPGQQYGDSLPPPIFDSSYVTRRWPESHTPMPI